MGSPMNELAPILEQARLFVVQHLPADVQANAIVAAIIFLVAGVGLSVLGAKLSRFGFTSLFVLLGALGGWQFARMSGFPTIVCIPVAAAMIGAIGHMTFRLWVGVAMAVVISALVLGAFGYQRVVPHVAEFEETSMVAWSPVHGATEFALPTPEQQQAYRDRTPQMWAKELWNYVTSKDLRLEQNGKSLAALTLVIGLFLGVVAVRWALILATSVAGTALVTTGIATLFTHFAPGSYQSFLNHPGVMGMAVGAFLVTSLALQTILTRKPPADETAAKS
jgi:hypothetical protein